MVKVPGQRPLVRVPPQVDTGQIARQPQVQPAVQQPLQPAQESGYEAKVENKFSERIHGATLGMTASEAIGYANELFASECYGPAVAGFLAECKTREEAVDMAEQMANDIKGNRKLDPLARQAMIKELSVQLGEVYAPDDPQVAELAAESFMKHVHPRKITLDAQAVGMQPDEIAVGQLEQLLDAFR